jgi:hypothetical protein
MGGLSFVKVLGEALANLEFPSDRPMQMIFTVPAVSPIGQDFSRMRNLLSQALLVMITGEGGAG